MDNTHLTSQNEKLKKAGLKLLYTEDGLTLTDGKLSIMVDFRDMLPRLKQSNLQNEMQVKAARIKGQPMPQKIIDATSGFGEDSLILAAAGFDVELYEFDDIIALLLEDGLNRAMDIPELAPIVSRMHFHHADSIQ
ncbi:MAG: class I SAM-dependent methyltransferase, partial [Pseudobutyrivibrio sp.]|nr:class I SAM-dependent methyltransferase [Pseudobutyrivibrio sp.]